jgi:pimeloyl-ACP methyl ester carboxylesterase
MTAALERGALGRGALGRGWGGEPPKRFTIAVEDAVLSDLQRRLEATRWPDEIFGSSWIYGTDLQYLKNLVDYWRKGYAWRDQEAALNQFHHFTVAIDDIDLHFIHEPGEGSAPFPLLLTHGWPGSIVEFQKLLPMLTHPSAFGGSARDAFTVVAPSIPGFGFSFRANQRRFGLREIADTFSSLMTEALGYRTFGAHGHDWGAFVATRLGYAHADKLAGIHITLLAIPRERPGGHKPTEEEDRFYAQLDHWLKEECGYSWIMGTKPQTLAYALSDSPVGLAAWVVEKFHSWSDCNGDLDAHFSRDVLLTNIMLYWVTGAIGSSFWPYYARLHEPRIVPSGEKVNVPTGYAEYPREILTPPRSLAENTYANLTRWTRMASGGHFPALEGPQQLAEEIRAFFRPLRA